MLKIIRIIEGEGAEIAFPTSTIHMAENEVLKSLVSPGGDKMVSDSG